MNITTTQPDEGQFVAVWLFQGETWSATVKVIDGVPREYLNPVFDEVTDETYGDTYDKTSRWQIPVIADAKIFIQM